MLSKVLKNGNFCYRINIRYFCTDNGDDRASTIKRLQHILSTIKDVNNQDNQQQTQRKQSIKEPTSPQYQQTRQQIFKDFQDKSRPIITRNEPKLFEQKRDNDDDLFMTNFDDEMDMKIDDDNISTKTILKEVKQQQKNMENIVKDNDESYKESFERLFGKDSDRTTTTSKHVDKISTQYQQDTIIDDREIRAAPKASMKMGGDIKEINTESDRKKPDTIKIANELKENERNRDNIEYFPDIKFDDDVSEFIYKYIQNNNGEYLPNYKDAVKEFPLLSIQNFKDIRKNVVDRLINELPNGNYCDDGGMNYDRNSWISMNMNRFDNYGYNRNDVNYFNRIDDNISNFNPYETDPKRDPFDYFYHSNSKIDYIGHRKDNISPRNTFYGYYNKVWDGFNDVGERVQVIIILYIIFIA